MRVPRQLWSTSVKALAWIVFAAGCGQWTGCERPIHLGPDFGYSLAEAMRVHTERGEGPPQEPAPGLDGQAARLLYGRYVKSFGEDGGPTGQSFAPLSNATMGEPGVGTSPGSPSPHLR